MWMTRARIASGIAAVVLLSLVPLSPTGFAHAQPSANGRSSGEETISLAEQNTAVSSSQTPESVAPQEADRCQVQRTIDTVYAAISGAAGVPRDWDAFRRVFSEDARLFTITPNGLRGGSVDDYIARSSDSLVAFGFREEELVNRIEIYGNLAQAWSSYEGHFVRDGEPGRIRGINSFQLQREADGNWRVHSLFWQQETREFPLPIDMFEASDRQIWTVSLGFPAAEPEIQSAIAHWVETYNRNDWAALAEQFTADAVMMPPGSPAVAGRSAIAAWEAANEDGFRIALVPEEISVAGGQAVVRGRSCVFIPLDGGKTSVDIGKFLEVRQRQPDGRWLVSRDIFNSDIPAGGDLADSCPYEILHAGPRHPHNASAAALPDLTPILENRTRVILEGIRSGDVSGIMALYGPGSLYSTDNATLLSDPADIENFWVNVAASPAHDAVLEVLRIERLGPNAFVEIQKYEVFDKAGERMFGGYASLLWRKMDGRWIIAADVSN